MHLTLEGLLYWAGRRVAETCYEQKKLHKINSSYWLVKSRFIGATNLGLKYEIYKERKKSKE